MDNDPGMTGLSFGAIKVGDSAEAERSVAANDLVFYSHASGDLNPLHLPELDGDGDGSPEAECPPALLMSMISALIGAKLPGPGTRETSWKAQTHKRVRLGDTVRLRVEVTARKDGQIILAARAEGPSGLAMTAEITAVPPEHPQHFGPYDLPDLLVRRHPHFDRLLSGCTALEPAVTAVVCPYTHDTLGGALAAAERGLITPVLVGEGARIEAAAREAGYDISAFEIADAPDNRAAAAAACRLVAEGRAQSLMKGHLHTDTLLRALVDRTHGLRGERRLSHVFVLDAPGVEHLVFVTDAAVNIAPDLAAKADITQNAIDLARALGVSRPRAGILSAVETVNPALASTLDAAALSKMAERGQITGGLVDGPLAMDNAVSPAAARAKGLSGPVAGRADILVAPNLESANMLAKQLIHMGRAESAGVLVGARAPVILTSRSDSQFSRLVSCAIAALHAAWLKTGAPASCLAHDGDGGE